MGARWYFYLFALCVYFSNEVTSWPQPILNGKLADQLKFRYHVSVEKFGISICGGGIIDDHYIVSAAHCFVNNQNEFEGHPLKVVVGTTDLNNECNHKVIADVEEIYIPAEYDTRKHTMGSRTTGDIAVLKLGSGLDIKNRKYLEKLELPVKDKKYVGKEVVVTGFGFNTYDRNLSHTAEGCGRRDNKLRYTKAMVMDSCLCAKLRKKPISSKHLCAAAKQYDPKRPVGVCDGDSGGPLVYKKKQLIGIVSTSPRDCREDKAPAIYTKVWPFVDFIKSVQEERGDPRVIRNITLTTTEQWADLFKMESMKL